MSYASVSAKLGKVASATKSISKEVYDKAEDAGHAPWYMWGYDGNASNTEHHSGRALDFMVKDKDDGDFIRNYLWTNRKRLRVQHVIWRQHITSTVTSPGVVRKMADRGNTTANHMDHVHVLFFPGSYQKPSSPSSPSTPTTPARKSDKEVAREVLRGEWGNDPERSAKLRSAGYNPATVQSAVNVLLQKAEDEKRPKSVSQIASEVIDGKWGNGNERKSKLKKAGYDPAKVQAEVNRLLGVKTKKTVSQMATEVIDGKWGVGSVRKDRLTRAGYNYEAIQAEVNRRL
ncbi:glycoside hydrolase [Streptomyces phage RosaAsantewaa]|nr:glycoside hydrolase [Streptomyces phage RosaAsantewaa]